MAILGAALMPTEICAVLLLLVCLLPIEIGGGTLGLALGISLATPPLVIFASPFSLPARFRLLFVVFGLVAVQILALFFVFTKGAAPLFQYAI